MARERFGVVLDPEALTVDEEATEALRHRMRKTADRSLSLPTGPGAGEFWKTRFRDGDELVVEETPVALKARPFSGGALTANRSLRRCGRLHELRRVSS